EQLDLSWQWPLPKLATLASLGASSSDTNRVGPLAQDGRWYSVGRLNYSMTDGKLVNAVMGFEYDGGCWLGRIVLDRQQTSAATATQRIMFQLEFVGFSRLGVSPLKTLQDNIPGYQILREPQAAPSRFSNYD
ncbi:MAG: LPS-assembly protein LptD, partial [Comamonadaceae bacterium CG17_big_fil_post_rev_8_21_14_2_50_60_13]